VVTYVLAALCVAMATYLYAAVCLVVGAKTTTFRLVRRRPEDERLDTRLGRLADAVALLTDATQAGFANLASEIELNRRTRTVKGTRAATSRRIARAVGSGRSVQEIAAEEQVSESEVGLHLGLAARSRAAQGRLKPGRA
jgi:hypothetical protein